MYTAFSPFICFCRLWLAPFNPTIARMEFRIFQSIFCQTYKIQKSAFAFNEYVEKVFEKFILAMIEIRPIDWLMLCVLVLLNWARNKLHLDYRKCAIHHDQLCEEENARIMFTVSGAIIFGLTALLAVESRRLEVRIMAQKNIRSIHTYPSYLRVIMAALYCTYVISAGHVLLFLLFLYVSLLFLYSTWRNLQKRKPWMHFD